MKFDDKLFIDFLNKLIVLDRNTRSALDLSNRKITNLTTVESNKWSSKRSEITEKTNYFISKDQGINSSLVKQFNKISSDDRVNKDRDYQFLKAANKQLGIIGGAKAAVAGFVDNMNGSSDPGVSAQDIIDGKINFAAKVKEITNIPGSRKQAKEATSFYALCNGCENVLRGSINAKRIFLTSNIETIHSSYNGASQSANGRFSSSWQEFNRSVPDFAETFSKAKVQIPSEIEDEYNEIIKSLNNRLQSLEYDFVHEFPADKINEEYIHIYELEPSYEDYQLAKEMTSDIRIGTFEYEISSLGFVENTIEFLAKNYPFMYKDGKIVLPYCPGFTKEFNYLFTFDGKNQEVVLNDARDMGMRLFMMLPPGKVNFTFVDPVKTGESFSMFNRLVSTDDRTSEVINGKIWHNPSDIENKLQTTIDHISNITQRCLQGKYKSIYDYNVDAGANSEAYKVLMLMDFPAGFTDQSLKLLEQIVSSGPKCGVFTIIYHNEAQYNKVNERSYPLIKNVEMNFMRFDYTKDYKKIVYSKEKVNNLPILFKNISKPKDDQLDDVIAILKKGIKNADKVVIGVDKMEAKAEKVESTRYGIRIPIGIHGANEVQYLTLGTGGSHHALIAGVTGSGKSSLLHTIILGLLQQYNPDELRIYLVDFKRGVEFKIYADYTLPSFKVVAIESEREFGYNILTEIEREQKIRATMFKRYHNVDRIEDYRDDANPNKDKMPRIVVIMDEFHELFNASDEIAKKSAMIMERIVRQGRAFGVHLILSSQSYSNISGVSKAVFDQMAVRIVLKCSKSDANLLLENGSAEIDQISIDDPGRAVYNSEAGDPNYNSHFRVAYIDPKEHDGMLQKIEKKWNTYLANKKYKNEKERLAAEKRNKTRILLSNIEDNKQSIFKQFTSYSEDLVAPGKLYIGEPLSISSDLGLELTRTEHSNLLMVGNETDKARSMFTFGILSLAINYWVKNHKAPSEPFIYVYNCKPLIDDFFEDTIKEVSLMLEDYVKYVETDTPSDIQDILKNLHSATTSMDPLAGHDTYLFVFGYQRAEELKSEIKLGNNDVADIDDFFNIMQPTQSNPDLSMKDMFNEVIKKGALKGVHTIIWQDSFDVLYQDDRDMISYFSLRVAFDMDREGFSRFVNENNINMMGENNAIYYNRSKDNQKFRPYQTPEVEFLEEICDQLK